MILAIEKELINLKKIFMNLEVEEIEEPTLFFENIGILDVFPRRLTVQEAEVLLDSSHNKKHGHKYIEFFSKCVEEITESIFIFRRPIWTNKKEEKMYKVQNINELINILQQIIEEECFYNIYLPEINTVFIGNFELSWPVYSNSDDFMAIEELTKEVGLFIRRN